MQIIKHIHIRFLIAIVVMMFYPFGVHAQTGILKGTVIDEKTKEPIPFASIIIEKNGKQIKRTAADFDGNYIIDSILPGIYDISTTTIGYNTLSIKNQIIKNGSTYRMNFCLKYSEKTIIEYFFSWKIPLIDKDPSPAGQTFTSEEINKMAW
jgi:hypothetical protein